MWLLCEADGAETEAESLIGATDVLWEEIDERETGESASGNLQDRPSLLRRRQLTLVQFHLQHHHKHSVSSLNTGIDP